MIELSPIGLQENYSNDLSADTINMSWALKNLKKGGEIILDEGTFHISQTIVTEAFKGKMTGAGIDKTHLVGRGSLVNGLHVFPLMKDADRARLFAPGFPPLFWFHNAPYVSNIPWEDLSTDLDMENLSLTVFGQGPSIDYFNARLNVVWACIIVSGSQSNYIENVHTRLVEHADVILKNIHMIGHGEDQTYGSNIQEGLIIWGGETWVPAPANQLPAAGGYFETDHLPINATAYVENCRFENLLTHALAMEGFMSRPGMDSPILQSNLIFPGPGQHEYPQATAVIRNNYFNNVGRGVNDPMGNVAFSSFVLSPSGAKITCSQNTYHQSMNKAVAVLSGGSTLISNFPKDPTDIHITENHIEMVPSDSLTANSPAIFIADFSLIENNSARLNVHIGSNKIVGKQGFNSHFIEHIGAGAVVENNILSGHADVGISVGNFTYQSLCLPAANDRIEKNTFQDFTGTPCVLGAGSSGIKMDSQGAAVIDNGANNQVD